RLWRAEQSRNRDAHPDERGTRGATTDVAEAGAERDNQEGCTTSARREPRMAQRHARACCGKARNCPVNPALRQRILRHHEIRLTYRSSLMHQDLVIFGGGVAGLWLLNRAREAGYSALLFEREALGAGQ